MKVGDIKAELKALGVTDLRHCVEKSDLEAELNRARTDAAAKPKGPAPYNDGLRYGRVAEIGNTRDPSALVVFLHGLGDSCDGWASTLEAIALKHPHVLFVLPTAAQLAVTLNGGMKMNAWYDIKAISVLSEEDSAGMRRSAAYVESLIAAAKYKHGSIAHDRVVYAGFSQGACTSLVAGLTAPVQAAGVAALSGYLGARDWVASQIKFTNTPIFMAHGTQDPMIPLQMHHLSAQALQTMCNVTDLTCKTYPMAHQACDAELSDFSDFLTKVIPSR